MYAVTTYTAVTPLPYFQVLGDPSYLAAAQRAGEVTWRYGLLRKGPGLCHGLAGNGYCLLALAATAATAEAAATAATAETAATATGEGAANKWLNRWAWISTVQ